MVCNGVLCQVSRWWTHLLVRIASFVVVLDKVLEDGGGVFILLMVTLGGGTLITLYGGLLVRILVNFSIPSAWHILSLVAVANVFWRAFRRWPTTMRVLYALKIVVAVQWIG